MEKKLPGYLDDFVDNVDKHFNDFKELEVYIDKKNQNITAFYCFHLFIDIHESIYSIDYYANKN